MMAMCCSNRTFPYDEGWRGGRFMVRIVTIETTGLGDRSYLAHDGRVAVVIDPQRDIDRVLKVADTEAVRITHVFETHIHNDYVTGGLALAETTGARYVVAAADEVSFERVGARDGSRFETGRLTVTAVATPGHTPNHLAYELQEALAGPVAVFTGGSLLFGSVGRTDLIDTRRTDSLTRAQFHSVRRLVDRLPAQTQVLPTHGFGSFCSATPTSGDHSTIGRERAINLAFSAEDEDSFVERLLAGFTAYPRYYARMGPLNRQGPRAPDLTPPQLFDAAELRRHIDAGEWVVDLRERRAFAHQHVTGTISLELGDSLATFLGWAMPWDRPLSLIGEHPEEVADAQRQLVRIGVDRLAGAAIGPTGQLAGGRVSRYRVCTFRDLSTVLGQPGVVVLDVRRPDEWEAGHLLGAYHIPFWELEERVGEVPAGQVWVHCAAGLRAALAASILDRAGRDPVLVADQWQQVAQLELPTTA